MLVLVPSHDDASRRASINLTGPELLAAIEAGTAPTILDVRSRGEFAQGHVPGAIHMPFQQVSRRAGEIPSSPDDPLVVYCGHGPRAWIAARFLRARGFRAVSYLTGHWSAWRRAGLRQER
jgi:rhodanese-related sulfurtransferase